MARSSLFPARRLARLALPLLLVTTPLLATACGSSSSAGGQSDSKIELRFSWWGSDSRHAYTQKIIQLYESKHPNVTIKPDYTSWSDYWNKLGTAVAGNNAPDIMQQEIRYIREYGDRGVLLDLTPYLGSTIADADFDPSVRDAGKIKGATYAIAVGVNAYSIIANPALFKQAGVAMPDDSTWTWDQLRDIAAKISKATPGDTWGLQEPGYYDSPVEIFARQQGLSGIYGEDGKLAVTKDVLTRWFTYIQSLSASGATPPPSKSVELQAGGVDQSLTGTGKGALGGWWTNELSAQSEASGAELELLRLPGDSTQAGTYFKPGMYWSVSAKSKHPKESADFVNFLLNDQDAAKLLLVDRGMPINLELRAAITPDLSAPDKQVVAFMDKIRPTIGAPAIIPPKGAGKVNDIITNINEKIIFKKLTPAQAADQFLQEASAAIS